MRHRHEFEGARRQLAARDLIAFESGVYQVLRLSRHPLPPGHELLTNASRPPTARLPVVGPPGCADELPWEQPPSCWKSLRDLLGIESEATKDE